MTWCLNVVSGGIFAVLMAGCAHSEPRGQAEVPSPRPMADFGLPVDVDRDAHPDLAAYARTVLTAQWEDSFEFTPNSSEGEPRTVANCSTLLTDEVALDNVSPTHYWQTVQRRDRQCRAAALVSDSQVAATTDWPDRILTAASIQRLPAEVMTRISGDQEETFVAHVAEGKSRWFQHEMIEFVGSEDDGRAEFVTDDGMRYWLSVLARTDVTGDGREDVVLLVAASPDAGSLKSHRLLVMEARDGAWWTAQEWDQGQ